MATRKDDYMVTGVFRDRAAADQALDAVAQRGVHADRVSVVMKDEARQRLYSGTEAGDAPGGTQERRRTAEGAGVGGAVGAGLGALITAALAVGAPVTIPGLIIAGPLAGALSGAGAGAVGGGLVGALIGSGMKQAVAEEYKHEIDKGHVAMAVTVENENDARQIEDAWKKYGDKIRRDSISGGAPRKTA